jgi:hypothetical protein
MLSGARKSWHNLKFGLFLLPTPAALVKFETDLLPFELTGIQGSKAGFVILTDRSDRS